MNHYSDLLNQPAQVKITTVLLVQSLLVVLFWESPIWKEPY